MIKIKTPIWNKRSVGIAEHKITDRIEVKITYRNITGEEIYPHVFTMSKKQALTYPTRSTKGVMLRIIPIADFDIKEEK